MKQRKTSKNVVGTVTEALRPVINELGYSLWDVEFVKEGADYFLRFTIDHADGVDINACEKVHRTIDPLLDEADPIEQAYALIVSGAGLTRVLRSDEHIDRAVKEGWNTELKLFAAVNGTKELAGVITAFDKDTVTVGETKIERKMISKMTSILE